MTDDIEPLPAVLAGIPLPPQELAVLLGVSPRTLRRWRAGTTTPTGAAALRVRLVGVLVDELQHAFTSEGIAAWFGRVHPELGARPVDLIDDRAATARLVDAARVSEG